MHLHVRASRPMLIAVVVAGFAVSGGPALANSSSDNGAQNRSDNAPGGAVTNVDDHRPAGAGQGRKVG